MTNVETPLTNLTIGITQNSLIELRGIIGWSVPTSFNILMVFRIRRGIGGPILWEGHDGIGVDEGELNGYLSSILHVDVVPLLGNNTYELTAQVDPVISLGRSAGVNGPIVFAATAYPL